MNKAVRIGMASLLVIHLATLAVDADPAEATAKVTFQKRDGELQIAIDNQPIADYVWQDEQILRPYFRHLRTRSGLQVTRSCPPVKGQDIDDHPTMHPGLWLAFGDLNGADFWRNKGRVRQVEIQEPQITPEGGTFSVKNAYEHDGKVLCTETRRITISPRADGYLLDWMSSFRPEESAIAFGDQEEMGLGVRVATPLAVVKGGQILNSEGQKNGDQVWGKQADWCEYGGLLKGQRVGIVLLPGTRNFRRSWFHARDYGLLVANPFGLNAFTKGETSKVVVPTGKDFSLRFHVFVYNTKPDQRPNVDEVYRATVKNVPATP